MSEDSMRCRRAPELAFETGDELSRHKEALKAVIGALRDLGLDYAHITAMVEKRVAAVLEPPEEFTEAEVVRWMCVSCDEVYDFKPVTANCGAKLNEHGGECEGTEYVKLTGTTKKPVRRAVIREYEVAAKVVKKCPPYGDGSCLRVGGGVLFADQPECHGKAGVLIFRTAE